jgi:hypothetical protein
MLIKFFAHSPSTGWSLGWFPEIQHLPVGLASSVQLVSKHEERGGVREGERGRNGAFAQKKSVSSLVRQGGTKRRAASESASSSSSS